MEYMFMPLKRYADFSGRSRRMEYWMWTLFQILIYVGVIVLSMIFGGGAMMSGDPTALAAAGGGVMIVFLLYFVWILATIVPSIAVAVRRLHDTERTGWWILAPVAPYLLIILAGVMAVSSPDMAATAGVIGLVAMLATFVLGIVLLVFYVLEGTRGPNKYGPDPKGENASEVFA